MSYKPTALCKERELRKKAEQERDEEREAFIEARKHREQFNSLLQSYEACWEEIKTALGEPEEGDQTCDLDRVLKAIRERDEARTVLERIVKLSINARRVEEDYAEWEKAVLAILDICALNTLKKSLNLENLLD